MTIKFYPSMSQGEPANTYDWTGTYAGFLLSKGKAYTLEHSEKAQVTLNGKPLSFDEWETVEFTNHATVEVRPLTYGGAMLIGSIIAAVVAVGASILLRPSVNARASGPGRGSSLEEPQGEANTARLGEVVPELLGRHKKFVDYLTPPHRYFASPREQRLKFLACVGPGYYEYNDNEVKIGDTPFSEFGDNASYQVYDPDADLSGDTAHENWYTSGEVGGTSSNTAGIELTSDPANRNNTNPASYTFEGSTITRSSGEFPQGWGAGAVVRVDIVDGITSVYDVTEGYGTPWGGSRITGFFGHVANLNQDAEITVSGAGLSGTYRIWSSVSLGDGVYTIQLYRLVESIDEHGNPEFTPQGVVADEGEQSMTFKGDAVDVTVAQNNGASIVILSSPFGTFSAAADIKYVRGRIQGEWTNAYISTPANETASLYEIDIFAPSGLAYIDGENLRDKSVDVAIQATNLDTGATYVFNRSYTNRTLDSIGWTERFELPEGRYKWRLSRNSTASTSTQDVDTAHWYALKAKLPTLTSYPNWTTMSVNLASGAKLAASSENQISLIPTRKLPTLNSSGTWSGNVATRDISAAVRYCAHSIGYTDDDLDLDELRRLHNIWTARGETLDCIFDATTVRDAINVMLGAGMSELTIANGQIRPVREGVRTQYEHPYSPQNMTKSLSRAFAAKKHDDADGVEVEYVDRETWTTKTIKCALPGSPRLKLEKMKLQFATDEVVAHRLGMRRCGELAYRRWEYSFETEMDALNSEYGSYVALIGNTKGYGQSMILEHIESVAGSALLHVSEPLQWEEGKAHLVAYRKPDGKLAGPFPAIKTNDEYTVIADIPKPWPEITLKHEPPHVYFGAVESWSFPALVTEINPNGMDRVGVRAVNYDARVYAYDDSFPE